MSPVHTNSNNWPAQKPKYRCLDTPSPSGQQETLKDVGHGLLRYTAGHCQTLSQMLPICKKSFSTWCVERDICFPADLFWSSLTSGCANLSNMLPNSADIATELSILMSATSGNSFSFHQYLQNRAHQLILLCYVHGVASRICL